MRVNRLSSTNSKLPSIVLESIWMRGMFLNNIVCRVRIVCSKGGWEIG